MTGHVQKWGDGLAVQVPEGVPAAGAAGGGTVAFTLADGRVVGGLGPDPALTLADLLEGITPDNYHPEWDVGPPAGKEVW